MRRMKEDKANEESLRDSIAFKVIRLRKTLLPCPAVPAKDKNHTPSPPLDLCASRTLSFSSPFRGRNLRTKCRFLLKRGCSTSNVENSDSRRAATPSCPSLVGSPRLFLSSQAVGAQALCANAQGRQAPVNSSTQCSDKKMKHSTRGVCFFVGKRH